MTRFRYDWNGPDSVVGAVISAVESMSGTEASSLPPLYRSVDPDALGDLLASLRENGSPDGSVTFPYDRYRITAAANGTIDVEPRRGTVTTAERFEATLGRLLGEAAVNGVEVAGRWEVISRSGRGEWTVEVSAPADGAGSD